MRVAKRTKPLLFVDLTTQDLRDMVFGVVRAHVEGAEEIVDEREDTIYVQVAQGNGVSDDLQDDLEDSSDYNITPHCNSDEVQVRFILEVSEDEVEQELTDLPAPTITKPEPVVVEAPAPARIPRRRG